VEFILILAILLVVAVFVTVPLRRPAGGGGEDEGEDSRLAELEVRKEAKYREIRDTEVDRATGKLSEEEWRRQDAELRGEAIAILRQIDELGGGG